MNFSYYWWYKSITPASFDPAPRTVETPLHPWARAEYNVRGIR